jgi:hypothetical protein
VKPTEDDSTPRLVRRMALALAVAAVTAACAGESTVRSRAAPRQDGARMSTPAGDVRGGSDMPGKGRGGEHKATRMR